jgi:preprotein translocase subunit SecF
VALVLFGGQAIQGFAQVMLYGVVVSTYLAICISTPMLIYIGLRGSETVKVPESRAAAAE